VGEGVHVDEGELEPRGKLAREGRLAVAAGARCDGNPAKATHAHTVPKSPPISPARRRTIVPAGIPIVAHNRNYGFIVAVGRNYPESGAGQV
jgi:hypothetical protein